MKRAGGARYVLRTRYINAIYPLDAICLQGKRKGVTGSHWIGRDVDKHHPLHWIVRRGRHL